MVPALLKFVVSTTDASWAVKAVEIFLSYSVVIITDAFDEELCKNLLEEEANLFQVLETGNRGKHRSLLPTLTAVFRMTERPTILSCRMTLLRLFSPITTRHWIITSSSYLLAAVGSSCQ